jgi:hypothetical protein
MIFYDAIKQDSSVKNYRKLYHTANQFSREK